MSINDLTELKGGGLVPNLDYANAHRFSPNETYTAPKNGYVLGSPVGTDNTGRITLNSVFHCYIGNAASEITFITIPIHQGDVIAISGTGAFTGNRYLWFVPIK